jgi:hypothetical protein
MRKEVGPLLQIYEVGERGSEEARGEKGIFRKHECKLAPKRFIMKTRTVYICDICGAEYNIEEKAKACEKIPTTPPLYKIGDKLRITAGRDKGDIVVIKDWSYINPEVAPGQFTHKITYRVEFDNGDSRIVFEDMLDYEVVK